MGRCAGVVLAVALMCAACVGAPAAAQKECSVEDVVVGSGGPLLGLCVAWKRSGLATIPDPRAPGQSEPYYHLAVRKSDPPYKRPPPNRDGEPGERLSRVDTDVECEPPSEDSLAYQSLKKLGKEGTFTEIEGDGDRPHASVRG